MIDVKFATEQVRRIMEALYPSAEKGWIKEMRLAIEIARSEAIAERVVSEWLQAVSIAPKPAQMRALVHQENEKEEKIQNSCDACGGTGLKTQWHLISYRGNSFLIESCKLLDFRLSDGPERALILAKTLSDNQTVLSSAVNCKCSPARPKECTRCQDCGIFGGQIGTKYDGPWKWCDCEAGIDRMDREPNCILEANKCRDQLLRKFPGKTMGAMISSQAKRLVLPAAEEYNGEF